MKDYVGNFIHLLTVVFMLEKSFSILFFLRKPRKYTIGKMPVYMRITVDGIPKEFSVQQDCEPERWNSDAQRARGTNDARGRGT